MKSKNTEVIILIISEKANNVLNGTIESLTSVIPTHLEISEPLELNQPLEQTELGVLIGMTGDVRGRIVIESRMSVFGEIGQIMFGMPIEGEMLHSFTGELGNMIAGNLSSNIYKKGLNMDITPPTVMEGATKMYGFNKAIRVNVSVEGKGELQIILMIEE